MILKKSWFSEVIKNVKGCQCCPVSMLIHGQLLPCGHPTITDTPIIWTATKSPAKMY